ncbi:hypothetical protein [Bryocella elongata]|nr:hypothetical protein [Bryocella elongata]
MPIFRSNPSNGRESTAESMSWRRSGHGSSARPQRPEEMRFRQPQDGAMDDPASRVASLRSSVPGLTGEPEDARLTGGTRSLMRRVLGLNVIAPAIAAASALPVVRRAPRGLKTQQPQVA